MSGVCCIGASPWIINFNVLLDGVKELEAARRIARAVSEKGGGLPRVQAMALKHEEGMKEGWLAFLISDVDQGRYMWTSQAAGKYRHECTRLNWDLIT